MRSRSINKPSRTPLRAALLAGAVTLALTAMSGTSWAGPTVTVSNPGDSFSTQWTALSANWPNNPTSLTTTGGATANFTLSSITNTSATHSAVFDVTIANTIQNPASSAISFTSFGWITNPLAKSAGASPVPPNTYSYSATASTTQKLSGVQVDVCLYGGQNCNGGGSGGLQGLYDTKWATTSNPSSTDITLTLDFSSSVSSLTFSGFYGKFQGPLGSQEVGGVMKGGNGTRVDDPEPGSLALLGTGLIGLGLVMRRRRRG